MMQPYPDFLKQINFIFAINGNIPETHRRMIEMIDAYFVGFQAAMVKFESAGMKKTLAYILQNAQVNLHEKINNYQQQMNELKSIHDIVPFELDDDHVDLIMQNIEQQVQKQQQQAMQSGGQKPNEQQFQQKLQESGAQNLRAQPQFIPDFLQQKKPEQEPIKKPDTQWQQLKQDIPQQQQKQDLPQNLQQKPVVSKIQKEISLDEDPVNLLGKILDDIKQSKIEKQEQNRQAKVQPPIQKEPNQQPQKVVSQPKEQLQQQQLLKKEEQQQQPQQPIIQRAQLPIIDNDINPQEQKVILKLVQQHLKKTYAKQKICTICLTEMDEDGIYQLTKCKHTFHLNCLKQYGENQSEIPIICPQQGCKTDYSADDLAKTISKKKRETLDQHSFNKFVLKNQTEYFQCPTPNCQSVYLIEGQFQICTNCQQMFCTRCRQEFHDGDCGDDKFQKMAMRDNYSQCLKCFHWVEKEYGCNHIICVCGHQFCYNCQKEWVGEECKCIEEEQQQEQQRLAGAGIQDFNQLIQQLMQAANRSQNP